jgi:hypothetical protein
LNPVLNLKSLKKVEEVVKKIDKELSDNDTDKTRQSDISKRNKPKIE